MQSSRVLLPVWALTSGSFVSRSPPARIPCWKSPDGQGHWLGPGSEGLDTTGHGTLGPAPSLLELREVPAARGYLSPSTIFHLKELQNFSTCQILQEQAASPQPA